MGETPEHSKISSTAKLVAYYRALSDIPYSADVAELMKAGETLEAILKTEGLSIESLNFMAPFVETRFKSLVSAVRREGVTQVIELASGLSLRGLLMTQEPGFTYVETDLPGIMEEKARIVATIREKYQLPAAPGLHFRDVNALDHEALAAAAAPFAPGKPIAIIHEGLFMYLTAEEKATAERGFHRLLSRFGGVWLTPDFTVNDGTRFSDTDIGVKLVRILTGVTQRDLMKNAFDSLEHVHEFFGALGFTVSYAPQADGTFALASLEKTGLPATVLDRFKSKLLRSIDFADDLTSHGCADR